MSFDFETMSGLEVFKQSEQTHFEFVVYAIGYVFVSVFVRVRLCVCVCVSFVHSNRADM